MTDPVTALTVPEVLRQAEQVIAKRGWCQDDFVNDDGAVCARGAINVVVAGDPWAELEDGYDARYPLAIEAATALAGYLGGCFPSVVSDWNDDEARTESEVRAALLAAAQRAEAGT